ncbi:Kinesin-like protein fla10 [Pleodorina starrii]|uniref:Kinesin-like protein n=1 Tax=Pleodorina starrii TaxID=330485 RepID=A0A9W6BPF6_9CHLO|nr:Kinesin-like protein fla10 [Pleodorina starrii]GLC63833.1 Kinesin-like protein fla10 [Pleodorina starrii]
MSSAESVKVVVRCRPLNSKEKQDGRQRIVDMDVDAGQVKVRNPKSDASEPPKAFTFDQVYDWSCQQRDVFDITARPLIDSCIEGYNGTIFAYGQTGTGKSHTMEGKDDPPELRGLIPNTFRYVFEIIARDSGTKEFLVRSSYLEIYNEEVRDLLGKDHSKKMELKESPDRGVYVKDLSQFVCKNYEEMNKVLKAGKDNRQVGATLMNQDSSRSHSIFTITIECIEKLEGAGGAAPAAPKPAAKGGDSNHVRVGKLNLVDLAGSERQDKTGATGDRLKEGIKINLSLTALGNVISALVDGKSGHVPYRDSKLTRLLQDSLGGNTKTVMVANIGPADWNYDETMSTLRYANRAKNIQNKPKINEDPKDAMLRQFQEEIKKLKEQLAARQAGGGGPVAAGPAAGASPTQRVVERTVEVDPDVDAIKEQMRKELEAKMQNDMSTEALDKAREEAEAAARSQLQAIIDDQSKTEAQRKAARDALKKQAEEARAIAAAIEKEKKEKEELEARIKEMEGKIVVGGVNMLEKVDELKQRSEDIKREAAIRKRQEEEAKRRLEELAAAQMDSDSKFASLDEEINVKSRQLKKLFEKYQAKKSELTDLQEQFQREREGMLEDYRILTQQIKLKNLIIACFIPPDYQDRIMQHCHWQDYDSTWSIDCIAYAGNAIRTNQELAAQEHEKEHAGENPDNERLKNCFFSYAQFEEAGVNGRPGTASKGRPGSAAGRPPGSAARRAIGGKLGGKDPTDIGSLRDSVNWGDDDDKKKAALPKAKGLVRDTVDPRLRSKAK